MRARQIHLPVDNFARVWSKGAVVFPTPAEQVSGGRPFIPVLRLFASKAVALAAEDARADDRAAAALVWFDYGGTRVRLSDPASRVLRAGAGGLEAVAKDSGAEH